MSFGEKWWENIGGNFGGKILEGIFGGKILEVEKMIGRKSDWYNSLYFLSMYYV